MGCLMGREFRLLLVILAALCLQQGATSAAETQLQVGYYDVACPEAEKIVKEEVKKAIKDSSDNPAGLVRLHFHDCFVRGCDASLLLDATPSNQLTEKISNASSSLHGFEIVDKIKTRLEAECKGVVSCADILAFAARDSLVMSRGLYYKVPAGRRDGSVSILLETAALPVPFMNLTQLIANFAKQGLDEDDLVTLAGVHTIGVAHCGTITSRLYNFSGSGKTDPALDPDYAEHLKQVCPQGPASFNTTLPMDPSSPTVFDNYYYKNVQGRRGLFASDQSLVSSASTAAKVKELAENRQLFEKKFAAAIVKMGLIEPLTGINGEIRENCRKVNS